MDCGKCWKCREGRGCIRSIQLAPSATPTRHPTVQPLLDKDKAWDKDMPAYKRLRNNGIQPKRIDDAAVLESRAEQQFEIEMAQLVPKAQRSKVEEGLAIVKEMDAQVSRPAGNVNPDE